MMEAQRSNPTDYVAESNPARISGQRRAIKRRSWLNSERFPAQFVENGFPDLAVGSVGRGHNGGDG